MFVSLGFHNLNAAKVHSSVVAFAACLFMNCSGVPADNYTKSSNIYDVNADGVPDLSFLPGEKRNTSFYDDGRRITRVTYPVNVVGLYGSELLCDDNGDVRFFKAGSTLPSSSESSFMTSCRLFFLRIDSVVTPFLNGRIDLQDFAVVTLRSAIDSTTIGWLSISFEDSAGSFAELEPPSYKFAFSNSNIAGGLE